ncbi:MAG: V-type ATPase subunit [Verrucomicrobia bacterium]|nr:V-type ATPase subunit [Verrucomicrobiota bacterium]
MARLMANNMDYLAARLHGRRSRMAEAERLDALCRARSVAELSRAVIADTELQAAADLQRRLVQDLVREVVGFRSDIGGAGSRMIEWMLVRFQVENLKVLVRGFATGAPLESLWPHLAALPREFALDAQALASAASLDEFAARMPKGPLQEGFLPAAAIYRDQPRPFFIEAALDRAWFAELLARAGAVSGEDADVIRALVWQETDIFHLRLVARGRFHYGLAPELLLPLHVAGTNVPRARFAAMLADPELPTAATRVVGRVIDSLPAEVDAAALETLAWNRFARLANRAFRRSHMGVGAVVGYVALRRVEIANLITLSEGIRVSVAGETIRARMTPRAGLEAAHV